MVVGPVPSPGGFSNRLSEARSKRRDSRTQAEEIYPKSISETLFGFVEETVEKELPAEIQVLQRYDTARRLMRDVVDLLHRE